MPPSEIDRDLTQLETLLKRLEAEYTMFFSGRQARPPWDTRTRVEAMVKRLDRTHMVNYGERFRFQTIQTRWSTLVELWDRGLRSREEGRAGSFPPPRSGTGESPARDRVIHVAALTDPLREEDKLRALYESVAEARREVGADSIPFHRFADLVRGHVDKMKAAGKSEVTFRVAVKDGRVEFKARADEGLSRERDR